MAVRRGEPHPEKNLPEEDRDLAYEQFPALNKKFYTSKWGPEQYLSARLKAAVLASSDSPLIAQAAAEGFEIGELKIAYSVDDDDSDEEAVDFLATESSVLVHHAAETLLRLYFAHEGLPPCPWLETARLRLFPVFKKKVADLLDSLGEADVQASVMEVFTGRRTPGEQATPAQEAAWNAQRDGLVALLGTAGWQLLNDSNLYNASKHGLALFPAQVGFAINFEEAAPEIDLSMEGRALQYLQVVKGPHGKRWEQRTGWVFAEANLSMTYLIARQISSLMSVARARYVGDKDKIQVLPVTTEMVEVASRAGWPKKTYLLQSFGEHLLYYAEPGDQPPVGEPDAPADAPLDSN